jgi:ABC-type spermidine/putrescine transport system permease subunit II
MTAAAHPAVPKPRRAGSLALLIWYVLVVVFLFAPIVVSIVYSFNLGTLGKQTALFTGWTTEWYAAAWNNPPLRRTVQTSLIVSFWTTLISVVIGSALGFALVRHPVARVRGMLSALTYFLLIVPETVMGVSLLLFYAVTGIRLGLWTLVVGITPLAISVTALIVRAGVLTLDRRLEEASADLGGSRIQTLRFVVLPHMAPAVAAGALIAYVFSFDNLVVSAFLTTPTVNTLPVYLYGTLQYGPSPAVYAASSLVFGFTIVLLAIAGLLYRVARRRSVGDSSAAASLRTNPI